MTAAGMGSVGFRLFGFPVQIQPSFWLLALLAATTAGVWQRSLAMIVVVALSVLVHELGHASLARRFGQQPVIALHLLGGVTSWIPTHDIGRGRNMLVTAAGPLAGFGLGLVSLAVALASGSEPREGLEPARVMLWAVDRLCMVNFFWSAINLLPVLPFDGGQLLALALGRSRRALTANLSLIFGVICAVALWFIGYEAAAIVFCAGGISSYAALRRQLKRAAAEPEGGWDRLLSHARAELSAGRIPRARALARAVRAGAATPEQRRSALEIWTWAALMASDTAELRQLHAAASNEGGMSDVLLWAAVEEALGEPDRALERVDAARREGDQRPELLALEVRLLLKAGRAAEAARRTEAIMEQIDADEARRVAREALAAGAPSEAAALYRRVFDSEHTAADAGHAARAYLRAGMPEPALQTLLDALAGGHAEPEALRADAELAVLAGDPRFEAALRR